MIKQRISKNKYKQQLRKLAHRIFDLSDSSQAVIFQKKQQLDEQMSISKFSFIVIGLISSVVTNKNKFKILEQQDLEKRLRYIIQIVQSFLENSSRNGNSLGSKRGGVGSLFPMDFGGKKSEIQEKLYKKIKQCKMPQDVEKYALRELSRLQKTQMTRSSQSSYIENYLEVLTDLPWSIQDPEVKDIKNAKKVLDQDHYGLQKVKKRILEHLAVKQLKGEIKSPTILCFVGPPGVGKTSLGKSIASALGRKFDRISLGGIQDYSLMRGHRRTYVGAMPGQFIQSLRKVKTKNPVILLDEIDKIGTSSNRGDPSSALLEILDPNQNQQFKDHYLEVKFDLSKIMFIATANQLNTIQPALLDRMEIIELSGYSLMQKIEIAKRYLVPKCLKENGLKLDEVQFSDEILQNLVLKYTMETGCRGLTRVISSVVRGIVYDIIDNNQKERKSILLNFSKIVEYLGPPIFDIEGEKIVNRSGVSLGLATSSLGGSLLVIETTAFPGQGRIHLTGKLGQCLKQSIITAISWMRSNIQFIEEVFGPLKLNQFNANKKKKQEQLKLNKQPSEKIFFQQSSQLSSSSSSSTSSSTSNDVIVTLSGNEVNKFFKNLNIHVHFPSAATPKDGPSAGITILMALISLITGVPVRNDVAMTGELSLQGQILPIGGTKQEYCDYMLGVKEKCLAAHRSGIRKVLFPVANGMQTIEISDDIKKELQIVLVDRVESAVLQAFSQDEIRKNLIKQVEHKPRL